MLHIYTVPEVAAPGTVTQTVAHLLTWDVLVIVGRAVGRRLRATCLLEVDACVLDALALAVNDDGRWRCGARLGRLEGEVSVDEARVVGVRALLGL